MGSVQNRVHYCCVSRDNQILYAYNNGGDQRNDSLAALCLEKTPPFHKWYFETISKRTYGFLIEDGFVYFVIVDEAFKRSSLLDFLENLRDELKKANRKNSRGSFSGTINVQDQLVRRLVASLEHVAQTNDLTCLPLSSPSVEQSEAGNSTKAPLLGRSNKQEKKKGKGKDHVNTLRGIELEEQRNSTDRVHVVESSNASSAAAAATNVPRRGRPSGSQSIERKWRRQVLIVLAIDAAICLTLFGVWLAICNGIECIRS